ncbi:unnamed protein product, partial [marine sediment metagenome]
MVRSTKQNRKIQLLARLSKLANDINEQHQLADEQLQSGLAHALNCGAMLKEAKSHVPHGQWQAWVADNCNFIPRTAQLYMRAVDRYPSVASKAQNIALLTLGDVIGTTAEPRPDKPVAASPAESRTKADGFLKFVYQSPESNRKHLLRYWDLRVKYLEILSADGWSLDRMSDVTGLSEDQISGTLDPFRQATRMLRTRFDTDENGAAYPKDVQTAYKYEAYGAITGVRYVDYLSA